MFRFGSTRFQLLCDPNKANGRHISYLATTELPLSNADADSLTAVLPLAKMVDYKDNSETLMKLGSGNALGILTQPISYYGTKDDAGFKKLTVGGFPDIPATRGQCVGVFCPFPGIEAIFEGAVDISGGNGPAIDGLVIKTGTGAIASGTTLNTALSVLNGAWRQAQTGDIVLGMLRQANLTPNNTGEIRIRVQFCSPTVK